MRLLPVIALFGFVACTPTADTQGTGTPTADLGTLGTQIDKSDQRVAASIAVASENSDKPGVVKAELGVAAAYLPKPDQTHIDYVRNRVARNNPEEYKRAEDAGRKLLAVIDSNFAKAEAEALKNKQALDNANKQITALKAEVAQAKKDVVTWTCAGIGACLALAAVALAWLRQFLGAAACAVGSASLLAFPSLVETPWFLPSLASLGGVCILGGAWYAFKTAKPATACPDPTHDAQEPPHQGSV
jgi:hypothetical protein